MRKRPRSIAPHYVRKGKAARAIYQTVHGALPTVQFEFMSRDTDEVIKVEMDIESATEFLNQAIAVHSVISPRLQTRTNIFN